MGAAPVDELFGSGEGQARPRVAGLVALIAAGLALAGLGLACSVIPGVLLILAAWGGVEAESDRVDSGYYAMSERPRVRALRFLAVSAVLVAVALLLLQGGLLLAGVYQPLWTMLLDWALGGPSFSL